MGTAARVMMPGDPPPSMERQSTPESEPVMIGGSSGEGDQEQSVRDIPLGPIAVLFGFPFWIFG